MRFLGAQAVLITVGCFGALAQSGEAPLRFEVASVRPAPPPAGGGVRIRFSGGPGTQDPGLFTAENFNFLALVMKAYDLHWPFQVSGPSWMSGEMYNVTAKVPQGATKEQFRLMLQQLLAERFGLKVHRDTKVMPAYDLVVAKGGSKLKESAPLTPADPGQPGPMPAGRLSMDENGFPVLPPGNGSMMIMAHGKAVMRAHEETAGDIASRLAGQAQYPVTDATGLKGKYDYTLHWVSDRGMVPRPPSDPTRATPIAPAEVDEGPALFVAIQEQLGLKLEPRKGPVEILVVDHAEKTPTEN
jgi:uncharacterized protein (TIGR03435 family)